MKLLTNVNIYWNKELRLAYIQGMTGDRPKYYIRVRFSEDSSNPYTKVDEMLETLKKVYRKMKEVRIYKVKWKYQKLY